MLGALGAIWTGVLEEDSQEPKNWQLMEIKHSLEGEVEKKMPTRGTRLVYIQIYIIHIHIYNI